MGYEHNNSHPHKTTHCRRDHILKQLLLLVKEIEEYDEHPQHYFQHHHGAVGEKHDHHAMTQDPSCPTEGLDLRKDEYYRPMTVDGEPGRPVLTRKADDRSRVKWCPPCFEIVPTMDYTISCYQPPHLKNMQGTEPWSVGVHQIGDHGNERRVHHLPEHIAGKDINQHYQHYDNRDVMARDGKHHGNQVYHCKRIPCPPEDQIDGKHHTIRDQAYQPHDQTKHHIAGKRHGHDREHPQEFHNDNKCFYDAVEDSSRRVFCQEDEHMQKSRQPYSGRPETYQEHRWEGGDGKGVHHHTKGTEWHQPHERSYIGSEHHRTEDLCNLKPKPGHEHHMHDHHEHEYQGHEHHKWGESKHYGLEHQAHEHHKWDESKHHGYEHQGHEHHKWGESKHHHDLFPKAVVMLEYKDDFRHHNVDKPHGRHSESKYYPVLIPKDVVWPNESHNIHARFNESKYEPVLIPKEVIQTRSLEHSKGHDEYQGHWGKIHHGSPLGLVQCQPSSVNVHHRSPLEYPMGHVENKPSCGKIHHGRPEPCRKELALEQYHGTNLNQRRNGLVPDAIGEKRSHGYNQSIICYDDRVRKEQQDDMKWDLYGGQNCSKVRPPLAYFTYPCPEGDNRHNHWSPPETTICRYPNTCMASCFEHPVMNNWVYQHPPYRSYIQRRDYKPF